jgi:hypothetical protein
MTSQELLNGLAELRERVCEKQDVCTGCPFNHWAKYPDNECCIIDEMITRINWVKGAGVDG